LDVPEESDDPGSSEATGSCPYCGEAVTLFVDPGGAARQEYVEDCPVCCRPWLVRTERVEPGVYRVELKPSD
jgi:hypothetical protein